MRYLTGAGVLATGLGPWLFAWWSVRLERFVAHGGEACPRCGGAADRIQRRPWHRWLGHLMRRGLTRRRCAACGWRGLGEATEMRHARG